MFTQVALYIFNTPHDKTLPEKLPVLRYKNEFLCNCIIIGDTENSGGVVFDPGGCACSILKKLESMNLTLSAIALTHAHVDHVIAAGRLAELTGADIYLHKADISLWNDVAKQCAFFNLPITTLPMPTRWLKHGDTLPFCGAEVIHTPGHTPGSTCFFIEQENLLISGDTLECGGIVRTDTPEGDPYLLRKSIASLFQLDDSVKVVPGHGAFTTIGDEKQRFSAPKADSTPDSTLLTKLQEHATGSEVLSEF